MNIHDATQRLLFQLYEIYDNREAANIADLVMENITGWKKIDRILNKQVPLTKPSIDLLEQYAADLGKHKPVQYVLKEAWFAGMKFYVNENVLIPRPETEELVQWTVSEGRKMIACVEKEITLIDIGTGSGCIPVAIKKQIPSLNVLACDVSEPALDVAESNARSQKVDISFRHVDFLDPLGWSGLPNVDIIVSNPPYIPVKDMPSMRENVVEFEPHVALFVENNDPLIFYRTIADFANVKLNLPGKIFVEIHESLAAEAADVFYQKSFSNVELRKDLQGKDRMLQITR